jgi:hypothetical protein
MLEVDVELRSVGVGLLSRSWRWAGLLGMCTWLELGLGLGLGLRVGL